MTPAQKKTDAAIKVKTAIEAIEDASEEIDYFDILSNDYALYAHSTIVGRALPSAHDGLKPVQRRILFQMYRDKLFPGGPPMKSQTISSSVMGMLHPHGDCYDAMVNMANMSIRLPLVDGRGSFGALYKAKAASSRYTEALLSKYGNLMVSELAENCVPTRVNTTGNHVDEPVTLPAKFPNLVINGSEGMTPGFSTKIPQHNPSEVLDAAIHRLNNPKCSIEDLIKILPGPDFTTGGMIVKDDPGIHSYLTTGVGGFEVRGVYTIDGNIIAISELPYGISTESFRNSLIKGIENGTIEGVADQSDLSDRINGLRIEIAVKRGVPAQRVADQLIAKTVLSNKFNARMVVLDEGLHPVTMNVMELIDAFIAHRLTVVRARTENALKAAKEKKEKLDGLITIMADLDKALEIIRSAKTHAQAAGGLMKQFSISSDQAAHVLGLTLRSLTGQDVLKLEANAKATAKEVDKLTKLLSSGKALRKEIVSELTELHAELDDPRRTRLVKEFDKVDLTPMTPRTSDTGWFLDDSGMFTGSTGAPMSTGALGCLMFDDGRIKLSDGKGLPKSVNMTPAAPDLGGLLSAKVVGPDQDVLVTTRSGKMLRIDAAKVRPQGVAGNGVAGIALTDGDKIVDMHPLSDDDVVLSISDLGYKVTPASEIPVKGRGTGGVMVHKLSKGDAGVGHCYVGRKFNVNGKDVEPTPRSKATVKDKVKEFNEL